MTAASPWMAACHSSMPNRDCQPDHQMMHFLAGTTDKCTTHQPSLAGQHYQPTRMAHARQSMYCTWPRNREEYCGCTAEEASCSCCVACRLLIAHTNEADASSLRYTHAVYMLYRKALNCMFQSWGNRDVFFGPQSISNLQTCMPHECNCSLEPLYSLEPPRPDGIVHRTLGTGCYPQLLSIARFHLCVPLSPVKASQYCAIHETMYRNYVHTVLCNGTFAICTDLSGRGQRCDGDAHHTKHELHA